VVQNAGGTHHRRCSATRQVSAIDLPKKNFAATTKTSHRGGAALARTCRRDGNPNRLSARHRRVQPKFGGYSSTAECGTLLRGHDPCGLRFFAGGTCFGAENDIVDWTNGILAGGCAISLAAPNWHSKRFRRSGPTCWWGGCRRTISDIWAAAGAPRRSGSTRAR